MEDYRKAYEEWLNDPYFDEGTRAELKAIENEIKRFGSVFIQRLSLYSRDCAVLSVPARPYEPVCCTACDAGTG